MKDTDEIWEGCSPPPKILTCNKEDYWKGINFIELEVAERGEFEKLFTVINLYRICGPMRIRQGSSRNPYLNHVPENKLCLPGDEVSGAWEGVQKGLHLFLEPSAFERLTHTTYNRELFKFERLDNPAIKALIDSLYLDVSTGHLYGPTLGENLVVSLLHLLLKKKNVYPKNSGNQISAKQMRLLDDIINENLNRSISLDLLANELGVSVRHLTRIFKSSTGTTPHQYILKQRVVRAKEMILAGKISFEEISEIVGFSNQAHMTTSFKKVLGATPLQIRHTRY